MSNAFTPTILVGAIMHESNTFTQRRTKLDEFMTVYGDNVRHHEKWMTSSAAGGILITLDAAQMRTLPAVFGHALPSGMIERDAYNSLRRSLLEVLGHERVDGVCMALHGSMCVEGLDDPEGDLLTAVRRRVGPRIPVLCALDMHASMTDEMVGAANAFTAYRTAPHTDQFDTGVRAAKLLVLSLQRRLQLKTVMVPIPVLIAGEQSESAAEPMCSLIRTAASVGEKVNVLSADYLLGFPWADYPHNRASVVVVGDEQEQSELEAIAGSLACHFWNSRGDFGYTTEALMLDEALDEATRSPHGPVIIADSGDNPTAGASEDLVGVLAHLLKRGIKNALVAVIVDAGAVNTCKASSQGDQVNLSLGRLAPEKGALPLMVEATLLCTGLYDQIDCAVVETSGITVIITHSRAEVTDPTLLKGLDVDCHDFHLCILKSGYLSPAYSEVATRKILALTPGETDERLNRLPYKRTLRPVFPIDSTVTFALCD